MQQKRRKKNRSEWVATHNETLRIVPDAVWEAAQANRLARLRCDFGHGPKRASYALTGIAKCGECGRKIGGHWQENADGSNRYSYYRCRHAMDIAGACGNKTKIRCRDLEQALVREIEAEFLDDEAVERLVKLVADLAAAQANMPDGRTVIEKQIAALTAEIGKLTKLAGRVPDIEEIVLRLKKLDDERRCLAERLQGSPRARAKYSTQELGMEVRKRVGRTLDHIKSTENVAMLRQQLQRVIEQIRIDGDGRVFVKWRSSQVLDWLDLTAVSGIVEAGTRSDNFGYSVEDGLFGWHQVKVGLLPNRARRCNSSSGVPQAAMPATSGFSGCSATFSMTQTVLLPGAGVSGFSGCSGTSAASVSKTVTTPPPGFSGFSGISTAPNAIAMPAASGFSGFSQAATPAPLDANSSSGFSGVKATP